MTELSYSSTCNKKNELLSILFNFCFSIFSHPLYFSYFIFFSPHILKLLSFLSPLFITTTLLLVAILTFTAPNNNSNNNPVVHEKTSSYSSSSETSNSKWGILLSLLHSFLAWLHSKADEIDEEMGFLGEVEAYLVMFQASIFEVFDPKSVQDLEALDESSVINFGESENQVMEKVDKVEEVEATRPKPIIEEAKSLESLFQENEELENMLPSEKEEKEEVKKLPLIDEFNKVDDEEEESKEKWPLRSGSKVKGNNNNRDMFMYTNNYNKVSDGEYVFANSGRVKSLSQRIEANLGSPESNWVYSGKGVGNNNNLGSFGSMRVEKEWRRTLACKLFEERHNADGSEGMDMLWETYENESNKVLQKSNTKKGKKDEAAEYSEEYEEEEEEEEMESKLCCLQALKFSTGKMNLGMGRPNLLKFSKALKGIGWLHHVGKHGKKSNH